MFCLSSHGEIADMPPKRNEKIFTVPKFEKFGNFGCGHFTKDSCQITRARKFSLGGKVLTPFNPENKGLIFSCELDILFQNPLFVLDSWENTLLYQTVDTASDRLIATLGTSNLQDLSSTSTQSQTHK